MPGSDSFEERRLARSVFPDDSRNSSAEFDGRVLVLPEVFKIQGDKLHLASTSVNHWPRSQVKQTGSRDRCQDLAEVCGFKSRRRLNQALAEAGKSAIINIKWRPGVVSLALETGQVGDRFALILGASSGFGAASAVELARAGMHIYGVHLDRKSRMPEVERVKSQIESLGRRAVFFNINAADPEKREAVIDEIAASAPEYSVRVFLHSLAFGSLGPLVACSGGDCVDQRGLEMTIDVMANSLVYWTRSLVEHKLLGFGSRVLAMTSSGDAVSAAKSALESHIRQLAVELAPLGITANALRAGVTDTPALRKIPEHALMIEKALARNPSGRLTEPSDVARVVALMADERAQWITGNVISVDGGEFISD